MRFLYAIVYKNGLFQILGFSSYQKNKKKKKLGMSDAYKKFCRGRPAYCAAHDFRPFTKVLFSMVMWIRLYENGIFATRENTALIRSTTLQNSIILYIFELTVFFFSLMLSSPEVIKPTALERRGYKYLVRKHHRRIVIYIIC